MPSSCVVRNGSVKSDVLTVSRSLPVYPDQRTFSEPVGMSQRCQHRTSSPDKGTDAQSRKVSTNDLSSRCFSLAYERSGKDRMGAVGAELLAPQPPSGCITAD